MQTQAIDNLTDAQRDCLRLVYLHHNSKEIAARMGVSPSAVDKRIERAVQMLGVVSRFEAARQLHQHEAGLSDFATDVPTYERLPSEPIDVPLPVPASPPIVAEDPWGLLRRFLGLDPGSGTLGRARVRTTRTQRFVRLVLVTVCIAIASVAVVSLLLTVTELLRANR